MDLGRRIGAEVKPKEAGEKYYPSLYVDRVPKGSGLAGKDAGDEFEAVILCRVKSKESKDDGSMSVQLEARTMKMT